MNKRLQVTCIMVGAVAIYTIVMANIIFSHSEAMKKLEVEQLSYAKVDNSLTIEAREVDKEVPEKKEILSLTEAYKKAKSAYDQLRRSK